MKIGIVPRGEPPGNHVIDLWRFNVLINCWSLKESNKIEYYNKNRRYDLIIVPLLLKNEKYFKQKEVKIIGDITDDVFSVPWHRFSIIGKIYNILRRAIQFRNQRLRWIISRCSSIVVGSEGQRRSLSRYNDLVYVITDSINNNKYRKERLLKKGKSFRIVWIGNKESLDGLVKIQNAIDKVSKIRDMKLVLITKESRKKSILDCYPRNINEFIDNQKISCEIVRWNIERYERDIADADLGIIPVDNKSAFTRNKPAGRPLIFMAAGIPVIASRIPSYQEIIDNGINGFLATTNDEWYEAIRMMVTSDKMRMAIGANGKNFALNNFSRKTFCTKYKHVIDSMV